MTKVKIREDRSWTDGSLVDPNTQAIIDYNEVYSAEFFEELANDLAIADPDQQYTLIQEVCYAAYLYDDLKRPFDKELYTKAYQAEQIRKFRTASKKMLEALDEFINFYGAGASRLLEEEWKKLLSHNDLENNRFKKALYSEHPQDLGRKYYNDFRQFIEVLHQSSENIKEEDLGEKYYLDSTSYRMKKWLGSIANAWLAHSAIPLTAGHYHEGIGYNSEALHILMKIMEPLDKSVTPQAMATALRSFVAK